MLRFLPLFFALSLTACASYTTPGGPVSLAKITDADIKEAYTREPAATLPLRLAVARVQAPGYYSKTNTGVSSGAFSVLTRRDIEKDEDFQGLAALDQVVDVAPLTRIFLPSSVSTVKDLRLSAAQLKTDVLVIYTLDTEFRTESGALGPLVTISLGFLPNRKSMVHATCSVALVDVRTGYIYGTAEATSVESKNSNFWKTAEAIDQARLTAERAAYLEAMSKIESNWGNMVLRQT